MAIDYSFSKVTQTELMSEALEIILPGTHVSSLARNNDFVSYDDGIYDNGFYLGNFVTNHTESISVTNLSSYLLTIPKHGAYSVKSKAKTNRSISKNSGVLTLSSEKVVYDSATKSVDDYVIFFLKSELNELLSIKYNIRDFKTDMITLSLKNEKVQACFQFIEATLKMTRSFPDIRDSILSKKNLKQIAMLMVSEIMAEGVNAKAAFNNNPEKQLVVLAEEIMDAKCEHLLTIHEVADQVFTSPRNLQRAFKKYRNYTPMQFLRSQKLEKAYHLLKNGNTVNCNVKQIALSVGIFDLNRFSKNYFLRFGEYPLDTLKHN